MSVVRANPRSLAKWVTRRRLYAVTGACTPLGCIQGTGVNFARSFRVSAKASMSEIFLYWGSGSAPCMKVMIALEEKGLKYKDKLMSFGNQEHKSEEIMKLNPRGQLPTLRHGDIIINESLAACVFLERMYPNQGTQLIPSDPVQLASVLQRSIESLNLHKKINEDIVAYQWFSKKEDIIQSVLETRKEAARTELALWESYLVQNGDQEFVAGKDFSQADVMFFPMIAFAVRIGLKLDKYPKISAYYDRVKVRPSVQNVWPPHWKTSDPGSLLADL